EGYVISEIDPLRGSVTFLNGLTLRRGEVVGDTNELAMQRVQIRETIASHFEKERELFEKGIKTLSLFFIDEVAKYKGYDKEGNEIKGIFQTIFEEEYINALNERKSLFSDEYQTYLDRFTPEQIHNGYFSIDKKGHITNGEKINKKSGLSEDISAYDLILKDKERLLSFDEPTRFIFSHSALREGWDNPNVFQICTLRHSSSTTAKRQEVGRGLRICVDSAGNRMDYETLGEDVHLINRLTVIANESYSSFTEALQKENREVLRERPVLATVDYFKGKTVRTADGSAYVLTDSDASRIVVYLEDNGYIDEHSHLTATYRTAVANGSVAPLPVKLQPVAEGVTKLINSIFDPSVLDDMVEDGNKTTTPENVLNDNFYKDEFKALWKEINHKYVYTVHYDSNELIDKAITSINSELAVSQLQYVMREGEQESVDEFGNERSRTKELRTVSTSTVPYDLVGEIARGTTLTRRTSAAILRGISPAKLLMFKNNPEEFIRKVIKLIKEQKATMIVEHIKYNITDGQYDSDIFTANKKTDFGKAYPASKHITDYVFTDGMSENSIEIKFAKALEAAEEVCVYAKLPRSFQIPTPVGNYAPDWAIAFNKGSVKHIFFIAETKGSMESMELRGVEKAKIACAKKLFNEMSDSVVKYHEADSYEKLL
ncbi:MAG: restriction endonuclease subunit R, partial [Candidatus Cryptobacteroides sp.]